MYVCIVESGLCGSAAHGSMAEKKWPKKSCLPHAVLAGHRSSYYFNIATQESVWFCRRLDLTVLIRSFNFNIVSINFKSFSINFNRFLIDLNWILVDSIDFQLVWMYFLLISIHFQVIVIDFDHFWFPIQFH